MRKLKIRKKVKPRKKIAIANAQSKTKERKVRIPRTPEQFSTMPEVEQEKWNRVSHGRVLKRPRSVNEMNILTPQGQAIADVPKSSERERNANHVAAITKWRRGERGAVAALAKFKGKTVAGHVLVTNPRVLAELEEAGELDFPELYVSPGGRG